MEVGSFNYEDDGACNGVGLVDIFKIFSTQGNFLWGDVLLKFIKGQDHHTP